MEKIIGITSTIPSEIVYAADRVPVDINNRFITSKDPVGLVRRAKMDGFPDTTCSWICGLYGTILAEGISTVVGVTGGDCSETIALMEVLAQKGLAVIPFAYPREPDPEALMREVARYAGYLGADLKRAEDLKREFDFIRERLHALDMLLWKENRGFGSEVQLFQLASSDFDGDPDVFARRLDEKLRETVDREPFKDMVRLGFTGVPPIIADLYECLERDGARVVFNEVQRQFSLPVPGTIAESYTAYTYPYGIYARARDIAEQVNLRRIDGVIHYVQAFCFRGIEDIVLRKALGVPVLTIQGDLPSRVTETMRVRIEAFTDMLARRKAKR